MPWYPHATKRPVSGHTDGPMSAHRGAVLHVNESNGNLFNWVAGDNNMSCHFEIYKDGTAEQYLDTADSSWCQMAGNAEWVSIETEGFHTEPLTDAQVQTIAGIMRWLHEVHSVPLQVTDSPDGSGFGWHGMGGNSWGGHFDCPGVQRKAQRADIIQLATGGDDLNEQQTKAVVQAEIIDALRTLVDGQDHGDWIASKHGKWAGAIARLRAARRARVVPSVKHRPRPSK